jgi:Protein of unknown function (DUF1566)
VILGNGNIIDHSAGLMWCQSMLYDCERNAAKEYCQNLKFHYHSDWRLPTANEIKTLFERVSKTKNSALADKIKWDDSWLFWTIDHVQDLPGSTLSRCIAVKGSGEELHFRSTGDRAIAFAVRRIAHTSDFRFDQYRLVVSSMPCQFGREQSL